MKNKRVLVLAPHTDDGEFGCGGTINSLIKNKANVYYAAFSACKQSVLKEFPEDILITEVKKATKVLGIEKENLILFDYNVRTFNFHRQEILDDILKLKKDLKPDLIFMPSINDIHQDHFTISNEGMRAFKFSTILCYELPWNNFNFNTSCFYKLSQEDVDAKINALSEYKSQYQRAYANPDFITSLAKVRGVQSGTDYAETFEIIRLFL
ncbi:MAG: PIG-L family deacetylase [Flavobacteriales bacterium]|nr:PIG-L family deacetylase [Flavobacteriales bacterium]